MEAGKGRQRMCGCKQPGTNKRILPGHRAFVYSFFHLLMVPVTSGFRLIGLGKGPSIDWTEVGEGVGGWEDCGGGLAPGEVVEDGAEGGGDEQVVVDEAAGEGIAGRVGDAPAEAVIGAGEDFHLAEFELEEKFFLNIMLKILRILSMIFFISSGFDDGEEVPAEVGFGFLGEEEGEDGFVARAGL